MCVCVSALPYPHIIARTYLNLWFSSVLVHVLKYVSMDICTLNALDLVRIDFYMVCEGVWVCMLVHVLKPLVFECAYART